MRKLQVPPWGTPLSPAQQRVLGAAARGNGLLFWGRPGMDGRGVRARWNIAHTLESLDLARLLAADAKGALYQWELTEKGHEIGLKVVLPPEATSA